MKGVLLPEKVSLCVVVRDEAGTLANCLESAKDLVDEIIIVDTGSEDETTTVARRYTDEVHIVAWQDDYSAARNEALKHAGGDWILQLDAADTLTLDQTGFKVLRTQVPGYLIETFVEMAGGGFQRVKRLLLYKNIPGLSYQGIFFDSPVAVLTNWAGKNLPSSLFPHAPGLKVVQHAQGDLSRKLDRRSRVLDKAMELEADNPNLLYEYCLTQRGLSRTDRTLGYLNRLPRQRQWFKDKRDSAAIGLLGFLGLAVLLNQVSSEHVRFFETTGQDVGDRINWSDVRLAVPYALWLKRAGRARDSIEILLQCIRNGIAGADAPVSLNERISPIVILLSLFHELKQSEAMYAFIGELADHLDASGLDLETVFEVVYGQDAELFAYIFEVLRTRRGTP